MDWITKHGHEVRVITTPPFYPKWKIDPHYDAHHYQKETKDNLVLWRCPIYIPAKPGFFKRLLHLLSFSTTLFPIFIFNLLWKPDLIWTVEPTFAPIPFIILFSKLAKIKSWIHIQDFEIDAAFEITSGGGKNIIKKILNKIHDWFLKKFDVISTISNNMRELLLQRHLNEKKCHLIPNWVDTHQIKPLDTPSPFRAQLGIDPEHTVALYSGSMGDKHGLEILIASFRALENTPISLVICGEGVNKNTLMRSAENLKNVFFLPLQPWEKFNELLNLADIHLLPQNPSATDLVMPSKLTSMLASGKPIIATTNPETSIAKIVSQCGIIVPPLASDMLAHEIASLAQNLPLRIKLGQKARAIAIEQFDQTKIMIDFFEKIRELTKK